MLRYVVAAVTALLPMSAIAATTPDAVPIHYWDVWVDRDGSTHQTSCEIEGFTPYSLGAGVQGIFIDMLPENPTAPGTRTPSRSGSFRSPDAGLSKRQMVIAWKWDPATPPSAVTRAPSPMLQAGSVISPVL
jgi:hypothetical protein